MKGEKKSGAAAPEKRKRGRPRSRPRCAGCDGVLGPDGRCRKCKGKTNTSTGDVAPPSKLRQRVAELENRTSFVEGVVTRFMADMRRLFTDDPPQAPAASTTTRAPTEDDDDGTEKGQ